MFCTLSEMTNKRWTINQYTVYVLFNLSQIYMGSDNLKRYQQLHREDVMEQESVLAESEQVNEHGGDVDQGMKRNQSNGQMRFKNPNLTRGRGITNMGLFHGQHS